MGHSLSQDFVVVGISVQEFQDLHQTLDVPETKTREKLCSFTQTRAINPADCGRNSWIHERDLSPGYLGQSASSQGKGDPPENTLTGPDGKVG